MRKIIVLSFIILDGVMQAPLFDKGTMPAFFSLIESKSSPSGVIVATFKRAGHVKT